MTIQLRFPALLIFLGILVPLRFSSFGLQQIQHAIVDAFWSQDLVANLLVRQGMIW